MAEALTHLAEDIANVAIGLGLAVAILTAVDLAVDAVLRLISGPA